MALYVALTTIFSGSGGTIVPANSFEYYCQSLMMLLGSSVWAYVISSGCGIIATLGKHQRSRSGPRQPLRLFQASLCCSSKPASAAAYVPSSIPSVRADPNGVHYRTKMDELNFFAKDKRLPRDMTIKLREFFTATQDVQRQTRYVRRSTTPTRDIPMTHLSLHARGMLCQGHAMPEACHARGYARGMLCQRHAMPAC